MGRMVPAQREPAEPWPVRSIKPIDPGGLLIETVWGAGTEAEPVRLILQAQFTCEGTTYLVRLGDGLSPPPAQPSPGAAEPGTEVE